MMLRVTITIVVIYTHFLWFKVMFTKLSSKPTANLRSRCFRCFGFGDLEREITMGKMVIDRMNTMMILIEAVIPNCINFSEFVVTNVRKPREVVRFVRKVAVPIFRITLVIAFALFP